MDDQIYPIGQQIYPIGQITHTSRSDGAPEPDGALKALARAKIIHYREVYRCLSLNFLFFVSFLNFKKKKRISYNLKPETGNKDAGLPSRSDDNQGDQQEGAVLLLCYAASAWPKQEHGFGLVNCCMHIIHMQATNQAPRVLLRNDNKGSSECLENCPLLHVHPVSCRSQKCSPAEMAMLHLSCVVGVLS